MFKSHPSSLCIKSSFLAPIAAIALSMPLAAGTNEVVQQVPLQIEEEREWHGWFQVNGYLPWVDITTANGVDVNLDPDDILESLEMTAQFTAGIRRDKWGFLLEAFYVDLEVDPGGRISSFEMEEWLVSGAVTYRLNEGDWGFVELMGGFRYTWVETSLESESGLLDFSADADNIDGMVGFRGAMEINDNWYMPFYADIGAGDSDFIGDAYVGLGYRYDSFDFMFGFRVIYYEFGDDAALDDELVYGPYLGAKFGF